MKFVILKSQTGTKNYIYQSKKKCKQNIHKYTQQKSIKNDILIYAMAPNFFQMNTNKDLKNKTEI